jgi:hypothetical protein
MDAVSPALPCAHTVRRLFDDLRLDGVLYVGRMPRAVFKRVRRFEPADIRRWQQTVWNHAVTPILVLFSDTQVWVYSGQSLPAREDQELDADGRLVRTLDSVTDILEFDNLVTWIESGEAFREGAAHFDRKKAVDGYLLKNIDVAARLLRDCPGRLRALKLEEAHQLLLRLLFTCYLIDREMISGCHFADRSPLNGLGRDHGLRAILEPLGPPKRRDMLCLLFRRIGVLFNGSAFDADDLAKEKELLSEEHVDVLMRFLRGDDLGDGQLALDFWAYDFKYVPIETISAIYESFLGDTQEGVRQETGAYYTPPHLAELVLDMALEDMPKPLLNCTVLDPACGSGTFLVGVFNRMAEQWRRENPRCDNLTRAQELQRVLKTQLYGIDANSTACETACFSLYLAYLDHLTAPDVEELRRDGVKLPKLLLRKGEKQAGGDTRTVIARNFFGSDRQLPRETFDLIVGNPPWVSRDKATDPDFLAWWAKHKDPAPQKQMACGFMWEILPLLEGEGRACFLLPAAILLGRTDRFQAAWFRRTEVDKIVDLSDLSFLLFHGADRPAVVMRFKTRRDGSDVYVEHAAPKTALTSQLGGPVTISDEDLARIPLTEVLYEADNERASLVWKTRLWGSPRDRRFLQRLQDMPSLEELAGKRTENKRWIKGQGFQPYSPNDEENNAEKLHGWWDADHLFLHAKSHDIHLLVDQEDCTEVGTEFDDLRRLPDRRLFERPKVLVSQGSKTMKVAFCGFPVLFRHSLQAIAGLPEDVDLLRFLAVVIHSTVAEYFLFHTSASLGTERDKTHFFELLRLPFPVPEETPEPKKSREIVMEVSRQFRDLAGRIRTGTLQLGRQGAISALQRQLEPHIREYYDVDTYEEMLIEDTIKVSKPSSTPGSPNTRVRALRRPTEEERLRYVDTICRALGSHTVAGFEGHITGTITCGPGAPVAFVTLTTSAEARPGRETTAPGDLSRSLWELARSLPSGRRSLAYVRNVKIIEKGRIHVVKPLTLRSWTRTAALNDADEIFGAILMRRGRNSWGS